MGVNWVKLDASLNHGSGSGDMLFFVPDSVFACAGSNPYVYLYSKFGVNYATNGGFEEWAPAVGPFNPPAPPPPPPASISGTVTDGSGALVMLTRHRRQRFYGNLYNQLHSQLLIHRLAAGHLHNYRDGAARVRRQRYDRHRERVHRRLRRQWHHNAYQLGRRAERHQLRLRRLSEQRRRLSWQPNRSKTRRPETSVRTNSHQCLGPCSAQGYLI